MESSAPPKIKPISAQTIRTSVETKVRETKQAGKSIVENKRITNEGKEAGKVAYQEIVGDQKAVEALPTVQEAIKELRRDLRVDLTNKRKTIVEETAKAWGDKKRNNAFWQEVHKRQTEDQTYQTAILETKETGKLLSSVAQKARSAAQSEIAQQLIKDNDPRIRIQQDSYVARNKKAPSVAYIANTLAAKILPEKLKNPTSKTTTEPSLSQTATLVPPGEKPREFTPFDQPETESIRPLHETTMPSEEILLAEVRRLNEQAAKARSALDKQRQKSPEILQKKGFSGGRLLEAFSAIKKSASKNILAPFAIISILNVGTTGAQFDMGSLPVAPPPPSHSITTTAPQPASAEVKIVTPQTPPPVEAKVVQKADAYGKITNANNEVFFPGSSTKIKLPSTSSQIELHGFTQDGNYRIKGYDPQTKMQFEVPIEEVAVTQGNLVKESLHNPMVGIRANLPESMEKLGKIGAGNVRIDAGWAEVNPDGSLKDKNVIALLEAAKQNNLKILVDMNPQQLLPREELHKRIQALLSYGDEDRVTFEIANEPDVFHFWHGDIDSFAEFVKIASEEAWKIKPDQKIVVGALSEPDKNGGETLHKMVASLKEKGVDMKRLTFAVHAYHYAEVLQDYIDRVQKETGSDKIMITEMGINLLAPEEQDELKKMIAIAKKTGSPFFFHQFEDFGPDPVDHATYGMVKHDGKFSTAANFVRYAAEQKKAA